MIALGATVAAAVALVLILGGRSREATLVFDEVLGLVEGSEVQAGGVAVGEVEEIRLGAGGFPHVEVALEGDVVLRRGVRATIVVSSGGARERRAIALEQGDGPPAGDRPTIGREATESPVEVDSALATLDPGTRRDVRALVERVDGSLRRRGPALDRTLAHSAGALREIARATDDVTRDGEALRTVVGEGARVSRAVAARREALGGAVEGLGVALATTAARQAELGTVLEQTPGTLRTARSALDRTRAATPQLRALVRELRPGARELPATAAELRPTLRAARPVLAEGRRLVASAPADVVALDGLLRETRPLVPLLRSVLDSVNPMLDQARVRTPDAIGAATGFADAASNYDAGGHGLRTGLIFAEPPERRIGPSEARPGRLAEPFTRTPGVLEAEPWLEFRRSFVAGEGDR